MKFEAIVILKGNIEIEEKEKLIYEIKKFMKNSTTKELGIKKMAYPIKENDKGYFINFEFEAEDKDVVIVPLK